MSWTGSCCVRCRRREQLVWKRSAQKQNQRQREQRSGIKLRQSDTVSGDCGLDRQMKVRISEARKFLLSLADPCLFSPSAVCETISHLGDICRVEGQASSSATK